MTAPKSCKPGAKGAAASTDLAACTESKPRPFPWRLSDLFSGDDTPIEVLKCRVVNYENGLQEDAEPDRVSLKRATRKLERGWLVLN